MKEYKITVDLNDWGKKLLNKDKFEITRGFENIPDLEELFGIIKEECPAELFNRQSICISLLNDNKDDYDNARFKEGDVVKIYVNDRKWFYGHVYRLTVNIVSVRCLAVKYAVRSGKISRDEIARWRGWRDARDFNFVFDSQSGLDLSKKKNDKWYIVPVTKVETEIYWDNENSCKLIDQILMTAVTYYRRAVDSGDYYDMIELLDRLKLVGITEKLVEMFSKYGREDLDHGVYGTVKTFKEMGQTNIDDFDQELGYEL